MTIRKDAVTLDRKIPFDVNGAMLSVGDTAPNFELTNTRWQTKTLQDYEDKIKIISVVPSLDTSVCSAQTHRFNNEAAGLGEDVVILTVSADLPYAQARWCGAEGIEAVVPLSDHKTMNFGDSYGLHVSLLRILQRAVFVLDQNNKIVYAEYVTEIGDEINFDAALDAARQLST